MINIPRNKRIVSKVAAFTSLESGDDINKVLILYRKDKVKASSFLTGFTLAETLVSVFILSLLISGMYGVLNVGNMAYLSDMGLLDLGQNTRQAMNSIVRELRASSAANIDTSDSSHITFTTPGFSAEYHHIDSNNDGVRDRIIRERAGATKILANDISNLCFCWDAAGNNCRTDCSTFFTIRVRAAKTVMRRPLAFSLIEKVRLRN